MNEQPKPWTFITNHARVLISIADNPGVRTRDIAERIGITERATQRIVAELEQAGYISHEKVGRRNQYDLKPAAHLRHPLEHNVEVRHLIDLLANHSLDN
jgi:predicted transcriptional regulator